MDELIFQINYDISIEDIEPILKYRISYVKMYKYWKLIFRILLFSVFLICTQLCIKILQLRIWYAASIIIIFCLIMVALFFNYDVMYIYKVKKKFSRSPVKTLILYFCKNKVVIKKEGIDEQISISLNDIYINEKEDIFEINDVVWIMKSRISPGKLEELYSYIIQYYIFTGRNIINVSMN